MIVVGAGAVGAATALALAEAGHKVTVLEKEAMPAMHQSGRNSGVIHAGYNVKPGTEKARYVVEGNREMHQFCNDQNVAVRRGGILVVAIAEGERATLNELQQRAQANGVKIRRVAEVASVEPFATGIDGLHAPEASSVDAVGYVQALQRRAEAAGAEFLFNTRVRGWKETAAGVEVITNRGKISAPKMWNAAGLWADKIAQDLAPDLRVVPFRGYYAQIAQPARQKVSSHIYRAPNLEFPFLGVHLSHRTDGRVFVGPGALPAFGREAYNFWSMRKDALDSLTWPGAWKMLSNPRVRKLIASEMGKSLSLRAMWAEARTLVPTLQRKDLHGGAAAGNRAQLVDRDGRLVDDIVVRQTARTVHVLNAVSPGLTCSLPFGRALARYA